MTKLAIPTRKIVNFDGNTSTTIHYIGEAAFGVEDSEAFWRIYALVYTGSNFTLRFADGDDDFNKVWDNRLSYIY